MSKHVVVSPGPAELWEGEVTAVFLQPPPGFDTAYLIYLDGWPKGFVASRRERGHATLWAHGESLDALGVPGAPSRPLAVSNLLFALGMSRG